MKNKLKKIMLVLAVMTLTVVLTACGEKSSFVKSNKVDSANQQKVSVTFKPTKNASDAALQREKITSYANHDKSFFKLVDSLHHTNKKDDNLITTFYNNKDQRAYLKADYLSASTNQDLKAIMSKFADKYITFTYSKLGQETDSGNFFSTGDLVVMLSNKKTQDAFNDAMSAAMKNTKNKNFTKNGDTVTHKFTHAELKSLLKKYNTVIKKDKDTKNYALRASEIDTTNDKIDASTVTEKVNTKQNKATIIIKNKGVTYQLNVAVAKDSTNVKLPDKSKLMSASQFEHEVMNSTRTYFDSKLSE